MLGPLPRSTGLTSRLFLFCIPILRISQKPLYEFVRGEAHINTAESFFSRLKRQLYGTHYAVSKKHLHRYVAEVAFKHNTRWYEDGERVARAIHGADGKRLRYRQPVEARRAR